MFRNFVKLKNAKKKIILSYHGSYLWPWMLLTFRNIVNKVLLLTLNAPAVVIPLLFLFYLDCGHFNVNIKSYLDCGHCFLVHLMLRFSPIHLVGAHHCQRLMAAYSFFHSFHYVCSLVFPFIPFISFDWTCRISLIFLLTPFIRTCPISLIFLFMPFIRTCPISWPKRKTLPWTSFLRAKAAARWLSYSTNMYLRQSPLLKYCS